MFTNRINRRTITTDENVAFQMQKQIQPSIVSYAIRESGAKRL